MNKKACFRQILAKTSSMIRQNSGKPALTELRVQLPVVTRKALEKLLNTGAYPYRNVNDLALHLLNEGMWTALGAQNALQFTEALAKLAEKPCSPAEPPNDS